MTGPFSEAKRSRKIVWLTALLSVAALGSLILWLSFDRPLRAGGAPSEVCVPVPSQGLAAFGDVIRNDSARELTITGVELVNPDNLVHADSYLMVINETTDGAVLGGGSTALDSSEDVADWKHRTKLGTVVLGSGDAANVIVALSLANPETNGTAEALRISYTDGMRRITADTTLRMLLTNEQSCF